jgi:hypothetical protein
VNDLLEWYGLGLALGVGLSSGVARRMARRQGLMFTHFLVALPGLLAAFVWLEWWAVLPILAGAVVGVFSFRRLSEAAVPAAALFALALAYVPVLGYLETLAAPVAGRRLAQRAAGRYAGLRVLAKD